MGQTADAVVIGGGIIGVATAFYLAREKYGKIVVLEKETFTGSGSTCKAAGGIRAQFATKGNIQMSMLSEKVFKNFKEETDSDAVYDQVGYMFLLQDDRDIEIFQKSYELQRSLGLDVQMLKQDEISQYAPHVRTDDIRQATLCLDDGLADPSDFLSGYEKAARRLGVEIAIETEVTGITVNGGQVSEVVTNQGSISSPMIINAAGAWSGQIAAMVGGELPVQPYRRQCVTTGELQFPKDRFPMVVDVKSGLYFHKESKGLLLGWADPSVQPSFDISNDPDYTDTILEKALDRIPLLETAELANQWAGLYETTPDHRAVIGWEPSVKGMFHVAGFSGHGMMHAPAAGIVTTEIVSGREPSLDVSEFSPTRFGKDELVEETNVI